MPLYMVNYDLNNQKDYTKLIEAIKTADGYAKPLKSAWVLVSPKTAYEVASYLAKFMDNDDGLLVVQIAHGDGVAAWMNTETEEWLENHMGKF